MIPKKPRVLVTGANGFTGSHLCPMLVEAGYEVFPLCFPPQGWPNEQALDFEGSDFESLLGSLPDVEYVVHLGARIGWDGSARADLLKPNVLASGQLALWAQRGKAYFIFASAALIAGTTTPYISPANGWQLQTENDYLYSKWLAEQLIAMSGVRSAILRISGIFGGAGPTHLGINRAISNALNGTPPTLIGNGLNTRNYIYVKDLCATILWLMQNPLSGTFLVGGKEPQTMTQMLTSICQVLLPGQQPQTQTGSAGYSQIVEPSPLLPAGRTFHEALVDIHATFNPSPSPNMGT